MEPGSRPRAPPASYIMRNGLSHETDNGPRPVNIRRESSPDRGPSMTASGTASSRESLLPASGRVLRSATAALVAINVLIFLMMAATSRHLLKFDGGLVLT